MNRQPEFTRGEVVLTQFPFTNLTGSKLRPAVIVSAGIFRQDVIIAAISSVLRRITDPFDYALAPTHPEFRLTGLRFASVVRTHKLATVEVQVIARRLGQLGPQAQADVDQLLRRALSL